MKKVNKEEIYNKLYIAQSKIRDYLEELQEGKYDLDTGVGKERFEDMMTTILCNLEEADNTVYAFEEFEGYEEHEETFDEFIERVMEHFTFTSDVDKEMNKKGLLQAIEVLKGRNGYAMFLGNVESEIVENKLTVSEGVITVKINGIVDEEFTHKYTNEFDETEEEDTEYEEENWEEDEDEESYQYDELDQTYEQYEAEEEPCSCIACQYELMNEQETVYTIVDGLTDSIKADAEYIIEAIEEHFGERQLGLSSNLVEDDYQLLRLYLRLKLNAGESEVESLNDRALMGAWNRHLMLKK